MLLILAFSSLAATSAPIELPAGEPVDDWVESLGMAGLVAAPHGIGPWVEVRANGANWTLIGHDSAGAERSVEVARPLTEADREDVALLADFFLKKHASRMQKNVRGFKPAAITTRELHAEWPIALQLEGSYHNLGLFLDRVSKFPRIINVGSMMSIFGASFAVPYAASKGAVSQLTRSHAVAFASIAST